jgi:hypothetical protein
MLACIYLLKLSIYGGGERCLQGFCWEAEGKRPVGPLGRPRRRWEDNIKMNLREIGIDGETGYSWLRIGSSGGIL